MEIIDKWHKYKLSCNREPGKKEILTFFKDKKINWDWYSGTTNQEVLRALIDRVKFLENQKHHKFNKEIIYHLRMALVLHEERHLERLVEEWFEVEKIDTNPDHFVESKNKNFNI